MEVHLLGTGTSQGVPVIGCDCETCLSDNPKDKRLRVSVLVRINDVNIVIDVGPDFRQQMLRANIQHLDAILLTHQHNDHIIGMDDVRPFNFRSGKHMPVFATPIVQKDLKKRFSYIFDTDPYPGAPRLTLYPINKGEPFRINNIKIIPIEVMHGRLPVLGYRIKNFTYLTDVKTIDERELKKIKGTEVLIVSAIHHRKHHSHLNLEQALSLIQKVAPKRAYLTHISHRMGLTNLINSKLPGNVKLAFDTQIIRM